MTNLNFLIDEAKRMDLRTFIEHDLGQPVHVSSIRNFYHCPFPDHQERTPSFAVHPGWYKCFGTCGRRGDLIDWFTEYHHMEFMDALRKITGKVPDEDTNPEERLRLATERAERTRKALEEQVERAQKAIEELRQAETWLKYHEQGGQQRIGLWKLRGIPEDFQNFWQLGYCDDYPLWRKQGDNWEAYWHTPSLSIPVRGHDCEVINVKHRLKNVPETGGKYRYEKNNIPAQPFIGMPDQKTGALFLTEGEIKAMVACITADNPHIQFMGLPAARPDEAILPLFGGYDPIYYCPDPDTCKGEQPAAWEMVKKLGTDRVRLIQLPYKIDDLINQYGLKKSWIATLIRTSRRVI